MTRLRVAYVAHSVDPRRGGMELVGARLLERLAGKVDLEVVAGDGLSTLPAGVRATWVPIPRWPNLARLVLFGVLGTVRLAGVRRRCDIVHTNGAVAIVRADLVTVHLSHALVVAAQGGVAPEGRTGMRAAAGALRRRLAWWLERRELRPGRVRQLVALSAADARDLADAFPSLPIEVISNGADLERFGSAPRVPRGAGAPLRVVVVAGDFERKGVPIAIDAVARTERCRLRVAGAGDVAAMQKLAERLGVADRVDLLGHVDDLAPLLAGSDVVLSCSAQESFGLALVEGAAAGCAVVCTETGVGPELVGPGDGGEVVGRDARSVAAALQRLDEDPTTCAAMGAIASVRARQFTWDAMADATLALYERLARRA